MNKIINNHIDFSFLDRPNRKTVLVVRTYMCGKRLGVVYTVDGRGCSTLVPRRFIINGYFRPSRLFLSMRLGITSGEYLSYDGEIRRTSTSRRA